MHAHALAVGATSILGRVSSYLAETNAWNAARTTPASDARKALVNTLIQSLIATGVWTKLDVLYLLAMDDSQASRLNLKSPGTFTATAVNAPTFTADRGWAGNGTTMYLDTGYHTLTNAIGYAQNSASLFVYSQTNTRTDSASSIGNASTILAPGECWINPWNSSVAGASVNINDSVTGQITVASPGSAIGLFTGSRTGSANVSLYRNAGLVEAVVSTSAGPAATGTTLRILGNQNASVGSSTRQISQAGAGAGLTAQNVADLYTAISTYNTAVGAA